MATRTIDEAFGLAASSSMPTASGHLILTLLVGMMKGGIVPKELWGVHRSIDLIVPRGFVIGSDESYHCYCQRSTEAGRYPVISLRTGDAFNKHPLIIYPGITCVVLGDSFNCPLDIPLGVEKLKFGSHFCGRSIILPPGLKELEFASTTGSFNHTLALPDSLKKLTLSGHYDRSLTLPEGLEYLKLGNLFRQRLTLPAGLKVLDMKNAESFNRPLQPGDHIEEVYFAHNFDQPITLPDSVHTVAFRRNFRDVVTFGAGLRSLIWHCNHALIVPNTTKELVLGYSFQQPLNLPQGIEKIRFCGPYNRPLVTTKRAEHKVQ